MLFSDEGAPDRGEYREVAGTAEPLMRLRLINRSRQYVCLDRVPSWPSQSGNSDVPGATQTDSSGRSRG
jgi:hypothetical protein